MDSKYIEETFGNYLKTPNTNHALLINGSWGSGKTYFWKNNLAAKCTENGFKSVYLSLNGVNKIEDLKYQFLIKIVPYLNILDSKKGSIGKSLIATLSSAFGNVNINDILKEIEIDSERLSTYVVCFDDLERCLISKAEILGFINNYVEHKNLKVMILSDESKIDEDDNYNNIKEKVIGRVLTYKNNLSKTLPFLFKKYETSNSGFYNFLNGQKSFILELLENYQEDNLRKVSFYLELLNGLYPIIKDFDDYIKEVVMFTLIFTIEFKTGNLTSNDYKDYKGLDALNWTYVVFNFERPADNNLHLFNATEQEPKEIDEIEEFYLRYLVEKINDYFFYTSIYAYILTGYLDKEKLHEELKSRYPEVIPEETIAFRKLINYSFRHLSSDEFKSLFTNVYQYTQEGKYSIYDYLQISAFLKYFSENKLIPQSKEEIQLAVIKGIEISKQRKETNKKLYDSIFRFKKEDDNPVIYNLVKDTHDEIEAEKIHEKVNFLLLALKENNEEEIDEIFKGDKLRKDLFQNLQPSELLKTLTLTTNEVLNKFTINLEDKYNFTNVKEFLSEDALFLIPFNDLLIEKLDDKDEYTINEFLLKELSAKTKEICEKLT
ncbi:hypothetical protein CSC80_10620 [Maribacter sp. 6B07]|uniref:P-loop NTPase fold protein n=1 Tax=Maribacter sp. 6B07 TaxID=2045442 RepID=UPI000C068520|nr:P-loop NTPase fold protein [Maribacter sp. 6B07]PHN93374.1 hypothetical protein CSC80_10620 [Maribacter sp. 6B07]